MKTLSPPLETQPQAVKRRSVQQPYWSVSVPMGRGDMREAVVRATVKQLHSAGGVAPECGWSWWVRAAGLPCLIKRWQVGTDKGCSFLPPSGGTAPPLSSVNKLVTVPTRRGELFAVSSSWFTKPGKKGQFGAEGQSLDNWRRLWLQNSTFKHVRR